MNKISGKPLKTRGSGILDVAGIPCLVLGLCQGRMEAAVKSHRKEMKRKKEEGEASAEVGGKTPSVGEFLSGFWVEDRLIPSITVTIFFGSEEWDGPLSLFEMMDVSDPDVLACMDNYHVRLIAPAQMTDVIEAITNSGIKYDESEEVVDVCQAIQEIRMEERKIGEQDGELKKAKEAAGNLHEMGLDTDKIAQAVGYAVETVKGWLGIES
jgi:hypothetical protein